MNILVTGGASGLGEAITLRLLQEENSKVYFTFYRSEENAKKIEKLYSNSKSVYCNFESETSIEELKLSLPQFDIDVLVNNAMTGMIKNHFHKINANDFLSSFQKNILPTIKITQAVISNFRKKKHGKIINILSSAGINKPPIGWSEYVANKAYLEALSKSWASENISFGITSNCISPSFMQTKLTADTDERIIEEMIKKHPLKKILTIEEVADSVAFIVTCTQHINGINLALNAGE